MNLRTIILFFALAVCLFSHPGMAQHAGQAIPERLIAGMSTRERVAFDVYLRHHQSGARKTTASSERLIGLYRGIGTAAGNLLNQDSAAYRYSGSRGVNPDLSFMSIDNMRMDMLFDSGTNYHWNSAQNRYAADKRVLRSFDAADRPDTFVYQQYTTSDWVNRIRGYYSYDTLGREINYWTDSWNVNTQQWDLSYRHTYNYNGTGLLIGDMAHRYNSVANSWEPDRELVYFYDINGKLEMFGEQSWNTSSSTWVPVWMDEFVYTAAGKLESLTSLYFDPGTASWINSYRDLSFYNAADQEIATAHQNGNGSAWEDADSVSHTLLNAAGLPLLDSAFSKVNGAWQFSSRTTNAYTGADLLSTVLLERQVNNILENYSREFYFYNAAGNITRHYDQYWQNGAWRTNAIASEQRYYYETYTTARVGNNPAAPALSVRLSPVPAVQRLTLGLELVRPGRISVLIYDAAGKLLQHSEGTASAGHYGQEISVAEWPAGLYFMRVTTGAGVWSGRFSVQH